ncbi:hypothetical protein SAMN04488589_1531 [Methanolobus vulcani]|uniref:DUF7845 domain-containing protein n=1 Tax=Methanolobus vulcani TaxID=38026 RepID=A0A7Z7AZU7_9EURY|nr:hypothetical protein [Methanolobus vulcani]SDF85352.1 hypothetical protein SAMN04488589_1531 [Methanolobus vulcani]
MVHKFPEPVTHEFGCYFHITDLDFYYAVVSYYSNNVTDGYNHHINIGDRSFKFWSKQGGLYNPKTKKLAFEYMLQWTDKEGASKCTYTIKPLFGAGTKTKTGKILNLPSVGTQIHIQSSYIDLDEHFDIIFELMDFLGAHRFQQKIDRSRSTIYQMARHIRYNEHFEHDIVTMLQAIEHESSMRGDSKLVKTLKSGKYDMYKLDNPDFSTCKIRTLYQHSVKSYRITNFLDRVPEDPLRHPKLEVFLKSDSKQNPSINEFLSLKGDLDKLLFSLLNFVAPLEYVSDNYFDSEKIFDYRYELPEWNYKQDKDKTENIDLGENIKAIKALAFIALQSEGCADFRDIQEQTEIPERSLWRYINHWKSEGILDTARESCTKVFFKTKRLWEKAKDPLINFCTTFNIGFKKIFGHVFVDSGVIRPYKERKKNLKPVKPRHKSTLEPVVVDTYRQAKQLSKEFKELGISRGIAVRSNHNTMRYSRVFG